MGVGAKLELLDADGTVVDDGVLNIGNGAGSQDFTFNNNFDVAAVRISGKDDSTTVEIAEVQVYGIPVAPISKSLIVPGSAVTSQSSNYESTHLGDPLLSSNAIDGDINSFSHTQYRGGVDAWWKVEFGFLAKVSKVTIFNRRDCCQYRMVGAKLELLDADGSVVADGVLNIGNGAGSQDFTFNTNFDVAAVRISGKDDSLDSTTVEIAEDSTTVEIAEVEVYGIPKTFEGRYLRAFL